MSNEQMRIGEFAAAAGVSARTVRYYIVEGLMPPPDGAGLGAMYGPSHLDRLQLILRLKDAYLPLKEIRRQLTGLDDAGVRRRLKEMDTATKTRSRTATSARQDESIQAIREDSAADYLHRIAEPGSRTTRPTSAAPPIGMTAYSPGELDAQDDDYERRAAEPPLPPTNPAAPVYPGYPPPGSPLTIGRAIPAALPPDPPSLPNEPYDTTATAENWVRLRIGDDVELLVRSGAYHRLRDRIDWLTGWARAIFR